VLKTASPTTVVEAPKENPRKILPSSKANTAFLILTELLIN
jgi:hypothetical protein